LLVRSEDDNVAAAAMADVAAAMAVVDVAAADVAVAAGVGGEMAMGCSIGSGEESSKYKL
jgi:hypothetical protein